VNGIRKTFGIGISVDYIASVPDFAVPSAERPASPVSAPDISRCLLPAMALRLLPKTKSKGGTMNIPIKELEDLTARAVRKYGYNEEETRIIGEVLLYAQLRGNSQGVVKLPGKGIPKNPEADEIAIGA
jgi:hypothetical protein